LCNFRLYILNKINFTDRYRLNVDLVCFVNYFSTASRWNFNVNTKNYPSEHNRE